jgi:hypothetical protein
MKNKHFASPLKTFLKTVRAAPNHPVFFGYATTGNGGNSRGKAPIPAVSCGIQWREPSTWAVNFLFVMVDVIVQHSVVH